MAVQDRRSARRGGGPVRSVLFVCTANICRSPFAEQYASWLLPDLTVDSAGTIALEGRGMDPPMVTQLQERGVPVTARHAGRQVSGADLDADLVLVMSRRHRRPLLEERPDAVDRVGLITSLPDLAAAVQGRVLDRRDVAAWARTSFRRPGVVDPYRLGDEVAAEAAGIIAENLEVLADLIAPESVAVFIDDDAPRSDDPPASAPAARSVPVQTSEEMPR